MHGSTGQGLGVAMKADDAFAEITPGPAPFDTPAHPLHPAEADLRFVANTARREPTHWWLGDIRRHQAECTWCERCDGAVAA
jgi:hypothetical protein